MFNSIRQYLSLSHNDGHNDEYVHQDNSWRQQKNHLIGNWLSDITQQAEEKESHGHFWNRRRKKYYKNDIYNDELYQQQHNLQHHHHHHQPQHQPHNQPQHLPHHLPQHHLQQQPMFERHRSHRSLSSLFRRESKSNLMHQQLHQPIFGNEANGHEHRRQRHNSLPSSYTGKHKTGHQNSFTAGHQHQQPFLTAGNMQQNGFSKHGALDNEFQQPYHSQQRHQQQQHMQMLNKAARHSSYGQEPPIYSKSMQHPPHFSQQQQQQQQQQQAYFNNNTGPNSARELQYQQMLYQQQQQQQFPYSGVNQGYRLGQNHRFYNGLRDHRINTLGPQGYT